MKIAASLLFAALVAVSTGCAESRAAELSSESADSLVQPVLTRTPAPPATGKISVQLTSATLGDDCGEGEPLPSSPPALAPKKKASSEYMEDRPGQGASRAARRACEQTSLQLAIVAPADGAPTSLRVKKVELYDDKGKLVGVLTPRTPRVWTASGAYESWDQKIAPGTALAVSYPMTKPDWAKVRNRFDRTYTVKVVVSIGNADQALQHDVYLAGEARLPPDVVT